MRSEKINDDKDRVKALEMRKRAIEIVAETRDKNDDQEKH
jgi:hypothetical protein